MGRTIVLKGDPVRKEGVASEQITPGELIEFGGANDLQKQSTAGAVARKAFAIENELVGGSIDDAYAAGDRVLYGVFRQGDEVLAWLNTNETANKGDILAGAGNGNLKVIDVVGIISQVEGAVIDDDDAASNGTAVYAHVDEKAEGAAPIAHLESTTAGNADTYFDIGEDGPRVRVLDDDAAGTGGLQVYYDEDATNEDERFLINNTVTGKDVFVIASDGRAIRLKHDAQAASNGVALYIDDDGADAHERLLFVSPTNADGSYKTDDVVTWRTIQGPETGVAVALEAKTTTTARARIKVEVL